MSTSSLSSVLQCLQAKATREKAAVASGSSDANCPAPPPPSSTVANALLFLLITLVLSAWVRGWVIG